MPLDSLSGVDPARIRRQINQRLSLRKPQEKSLEILAEGASMLDLGKMEVAPDEALKRINAAYPTVEDFERDFPSLCFALATGVGKTRLMGAMLAFLFLTGRARNFFILAPNTTIYEKLRSDFSDQSSPKYVFRGIAQFAQTPPIIVTGDTWQEGRGVRGGDLFGESAVINIFNVDKINKDKGKVKRLHEYIGQSYFDYLAGLPDLVLFMDEAHRYRAKAGMKAVAELKPILGVELTATPKTVGASPKDFRNVIYSYSLGDAMADGFVKEPAVATRADFKRADYTPEQLETIMLEDGIHYHEHVKLRLDLYSRETGLRRVTPFVLVVAQDTTHADEIRERIERDDFFGGRYRNKVAVVHSNLRGEESDDAVQRLISLETDHATEIVIHVNKLKEGWDVTNLYTIIPLRASASEILTEQTLGRGLRLPYGARTGNEDVDRLTVIAHDRFDAVIERAKAEDSIVKVKQIILGGGEGQIPLGGEKLIDVPTVIDTMITGRRPSGVEEEKTPILFDTEEKRAVARAAVEVIKTYERRITTGIQGLSKEAVREEIKQDLKRVVREMPEYNQGSLEGVVDLPDTDAIADAVIAATIEHTIDIPEIVVVPTGDVTFGFHDLDLKGLESVRKQPISDRILIRDLRTDVQRELARAVEGATEERLEDYIVRHLIAFDEVDYDEHADLLYKLAGQVIAHLRSYLDTPEDVENVALGHGKDFADFIFMQMKEQLWETPAEYRANVTRGFRVLEAQHFAIQNDKLRDYRQQATPLSATKSFLFHGFSKCVYPYQRFHSDAERRFAELIDREFEKSVVRWIKPGSKQFRIEYLRGEEYEPDFVVETDTEKLIVEIKAKSELDDVTVEAKSRAAVTWIKHANEHAKSTGGKRWSYLVVPDSALDQSATLSGLASTCRVS